MSENKDKSVKLSSLYRAFITKARAVLGGEVAAENELFLSAMVFKNTLWLQHQAPGHELLRETLRRMSEGEVMDEDTTACANFLAALGALGAVRDGVLGSGNEKATEIASWLVSYGVEYLFGQQVDALDAQQAAQRLGGGAKIIQLGGGPHGSPSLN